MTEYELPARHTTRHRLRQIWRRFPGFALGLFLASIQFTLLWASDELAEKSCYGCPADFSIAQRQALIWGLFFVYQGCLFLLAYRNENRSWIFQILMSVARHISMSGEHKPRELPEVTVERDGERVFPDENALGWGFLSMWGGFGSIFYAFFGFSLWFFILTLLMLPVSWRLATGLRRPKQE